MKVLLYLCSFHYNYIKDINISHDLRKFSPRRYLTAISISCAKTTDLKAGEKYIFFSCISGGLQLSHMLHTFSYECFERTDHYIRIQVLKRETSVFSMPLTCMIRKKLSLQENYHRCYSHGPFCTSPLAPDYVGTPRGPNSSLTP